MWPLWLSTTPPQIETSLPRAIIGRSGFGLVEGGGMCFKTYLHCYSDTTETSCGWDRCRKKDSEHLLPVRAHLPLCGPNPRLPPPAGKQFLLASEEAVLGVLLSITHYSGRDLCRQRNKEHIPLKGLVSITESSAWAAKARSLSFLSHPIRSENR